MAKIDKETAELMFQEFCDNWRIKTDTSKFTKEDTEAFDQARERIIDAFEQGTLENVDSKTLEYRFQITDELNCQSIKVRRPRGSTYMEGDAGKKDDNMKKMFSMLAEMTGKTPSFYSKVDGIDIKILTSITTLFFGS